MHRNKHTWLVQLQKSSGEIIERPYSVYWDPTREDAADLVKDSCAAELTVFEGGGIDAATGTFRTTYAGLTAVYQPPVKEPVAA